MANLLWVVFSLPLITMPLALLGLFACMFHWMDDRRTQTFSIFFRTIRKVWWKSYLLFILDLLIAAFLVLNFLIVFQMGLSNPLAVFSLGATIFVTVIFLAANLPAWVLLAVWDAPLKQVIWFSVRLVFLQPIWTIGLAALIAVIIVVSLVSPVAVFVSVTGALSAYLASKVTSNLVQKYIPRDNFQFVDVI